MTSYPSANSFTTSHEFPRRNNPQLKCGTRQLVESFFEFLEKVLAEPDVEYEFDAVKEEYDPLDPDAALRYEYYNPDPLDYIDALRAGYTFDSMVDPI